MQTMREKWTDERLDDLNVRVGEGFRRVDDEFRALRGEMNSRFEATHRLIIQVGAGLFGTMAMGFIGMVVTLIFTGH